jgi:signal transduction histidine kinase
VFRIAECIRDKHDIKLVLMAAGLCMASYFVAAFVLHHVHATRPQGRRMWLVGVGLLAGGGTWATHFVAMLAYQPGFPLTFLPGPTLLSAVLGVAGSAGAVIVGDTFRTRMGALAAGALMASGIVSLHFVGMLGIHAAVVSWNLWIVGVASSGCLLGCCLGMFCGLAIPGFRGQLIGASFLVASVLELHLAAMGALTILPAPDADLGARHLGGPELAALIAGVAASILMIVGALALAEGRVNSARLADLSAQRRAEKAEAENQAKSQFLATMSHELRTPLSAITSYAELIRETARDAGRETEAADADVIVEASHHLLTLISEILDFSKLESSQKPFDIAPFQISRLLEEIATATRALAAKNNNILEVNADPGLGDLHSDILRVRQCVLNLVSNAAKFTRDGAIGLSVKSAAYKLTPGVAIEVCDSGIGISPTALATIFEPFKQADETIERRFGGTGLGLAITKELVVRLGGEIGVESTPGRGSTFSIWLPLAPASTNAGQPEAA